MIFHPPIFCVTTPTVPRRSAATTGRGNTAKWSLGYLTMTPARGAVGTVVFSPRRTTYMFIKELDPFGSDETVAIGQWPDISAVMECPLGSESCSAQTAWVDPIAINPNVLTAKISMMVELETTGR